MKIRALKTTTGLPRGSVADVDDYTARDLIAQGYAIEVIPVEQQIVARLEADNDNDPFVQAGGPTGAAVQESLLPADQVQQTSTLSADEDELTEPEGQLDSSQSITDTDSARGQTRSTPATVTGGKRKRGRPRFRG